VLLVEATSRLGNKLRLTGGGHGNVSHLGSVDDHLAHIPRHPEFARPSLEGLDVDALRAFLAQCGVPTISDEQGRVLPASRNAHQLAAALRAHCLQNGVTFRLASPVERLLRGGATVRGIVAAGQEIGAAAVILAAGGACYPQTGSDGSGLRLAEAVGHSIVPLQPGLVALQGDPAQIGGLEGLTLTEAVVSLEQEGHAVDQRRGALLFTRRGLSGPVVHNLSLLRKAPFQGERLIVHWLATQGLDTDQARAACARAAHRSWHSLLLAGMPARLAQHVSNRLGLALGAPWRTLDGRARQRALTLADRLPFEVRGAAPLAQAMVTLGGIDTAEVSAESMASRLVNGLFFAGEILDVTGESGGYNLQLAFATGRLAGCSAAAWIAASGAGVPEHGASELGA
jgi:hypothetical protein